MPGRGSEMELPGKNLQECVGPLQSVAECHTQCQLKTTVIQTMGLAYHDMEGNTTWDGAVIRWHSLLEVFIDEE